MRLKSSFSEAIGSCLWFPEHVFLQLHAAGHSRPNALESFAKAALAEAGQVVRGRPPEIRVAEVETRLAVALEAAVGQVRAVV